jgi:hypothetical protein
MLTITLTKIGTNETSADNLHDSNSSLSIFFPTNATWSVNDVESNMQSAYNSTMYFFIKDTISRKVICRSDSFMLKGAAGAPTTWKASEALLANRTSTAPPSSSSDSADAGNARDKRTMAIEIAVTLGVGLLVLCCIIWWLWRTKWRKGKTGGDEGYEKPELSGEPLKPQFYEMEGDGGVAELEGTPQPQNIGSGVQVHDPEPRVRSTHGSVHDEPSSPSVSTSREVPQPEERPYLAPGS